MSTVVNIDYTNWKGERRIRRILPMRMCYASTEWHPERQWILEAADLDDAIGKDEVIIKGFAMKDIHSWEPVK
jgi:hypothetical protein